MRDIDEMEVSEVFSLLEGLKKFKELAGMKVMAKGMGF